MGCYFFSRKMYAVIFEDVSEGAQPGLRGRRARENGVWKREGEKERAVGSCWDRPVRSVIWWRFALQ